MNIMYYTWRSKLSKSVSFHTTNSKRPHTAPTNCKKKDNSLSNAKEFKWKWKLNKK